MLRPPQSVVLLLLEAGLLSPRIGIRSSAASFNCTLYLLETTSMKVSSPCAELCRFRSSDLAAFRRKIVAEEKYRAQCNAEDCFEVIKQSVKCRNVC